MTSQSISKRMAIHRRDAKNGCQFASHRAWRKYGEPGVKILAVVERHMLRETERKAIAAFHTMIPNGYNLMAGGEGGGVSERTRAKLSVAHKGKPKSEEHRRKIALGQLGRIGTWIGKKHSPEHVKKRVAAMANYSHSHETRKRMSDSAKGRVMSEEQKKRISESMKVVRGEKSWSTKKILCAKGSES